MRYKSVIASQARSILTHILQQAKISTGSVLQNSMSRVARERAQRNTESDPAFRFVKLVNYKGLLFSWAVVDLL
jgi:hypothetical protein